MEIIRSTSLNATFQVLAMTAISKLLLGGTAMIAITNISLAGCKADWALPVMIAIAASPPLVFDNSSRSLMAKWPLTKDLVPQI
jgi:hypothetical protein